MKEKFVFTGHVDVRKEDSGKAMVSEAFDEEQDQHLWVELGSWDDSGEHPALSCLSGRRVKITIEVDNG